MALAHEFGVLINFDVGRDAVIFDFPITTESIESPTGCGDMPTIEKRRIAADANESAPSFHTDERAEAGFTEIPRHGVAARAGKLIDDHDFGSEDGLRGIGDVFAFAGHDSAHGMTAEIFDDVIGDIAAVVVAFVENRALLADLREEITIEAGVAPVRGIG